MKKIIKMQNVVAPVATLNEQQELAIANLTGRHVINSGAGTGKSGGTRRRSDGKTAHAG